jgi:3-hydroxyisobutyrate dehydrogenase-like beta-hydroxyacid dehydrogenase
MGAAMVRRLAAAGHEVTVWNRTRNTADALAAALGETVAVAATPASAVTGADVVIAVLADGRTTCEVLLDTRLLEVLDEDVIVVDHGTSGVAASRDLMDGLSAAGVAFLDAPVSGSVPSVESGSLLVMASGAAEVVERATPVLSAYARLVQWVGPAGAGQVMKLAVNLVVYDLNAAVSESLVLAESAGITRELAYSVLEESVVAAPYVKYKKPAFLDSNQPVAMSLDLVAKDLGLIQDLASNVGAPVTATAAVAELVDAAREAGFGPSDMSALSRVHTNS